jgi:hypothetical protein
MRLRPAKQILELSRHEMPDGMARENVNFGTGLGLAPEPVMKRFHVALY